VGFGGFWWVFAEVIWVLRSSRSPQRMKSFCRRRARVLRCVFRLLASISSRNSASPSVTISFTFSFPGPGLISSTSKQNRHAHFHFFCLVISEPASEGTLDETILMSSEPSVASSWESSSSSFSSSLSESASYSLIFSRTAKSARLGGKKSITRTVAQEQMFWKGRIIEVPLGVVWAWVLEVSRMEERGRGGVREWEQATV